MDASLKPNLGFSIDFRTNWSDLKDQIFYERNGRFAKKDDQQAFNTTHDASSLMELCARDNKVVELYGQFLQAERDTQRICELSSEDHEQGVQEEDKEHIREGEQ